MYWFTGQVCFLVVTRGPLETQDLSRTDVTITSAGIPANRECMADTVRLQCRQICVCCMRATCRHSCTCIICPAYYTCMIFRLPCYNKTPHKMQACRMCIVYLMPSPPHPPGELRSIWCSPIRLQYKIDPSTLL